MEFLNGILGDMSQFHFLRPLWFLLLIPTTLGLLYLRTSSRQSGGWQRHIDPALLPYLRVDQHQTGRKSGASQHWIWWCLWPILTTALAGPSWHKLPQPVHQTEQALIVVFDLSPSMLAADLKPNRLTRAGYKLRDLMALRGEGQTGLVAYGGDAYVISPLTDDPNTIAAMVPSLHPNIMPQQGSNVEAAVEKALELAFQSGFSQGDLILITDGIANSARGPVTSLVDGAGNFTLSILGVGTEEGAPIPLERGGFAKDNSGAIVVPKLVSKRLRSIAANNRGRYSAITADDSDLSYLLAARNSLAPDATVELERQFDIWDDRGWMLIPLLLPLALLLFRRGALLSIILLPLLMQSPDASALGWRDLWQTPDQQGQQARDKGDNAAASELFESPMHRGTAAYDAGDYATAAEAFAELDSAEAHYNRGNALAKSGQLAEALDAYDQALARDTELTQASTNRKLVEELLKNQQKPDNQDEKNQQDSNDNSGNTSDENSAQNSQDGSENNSPNPQQPDQQQPDQQQSGNKSPDQQGEQNQQGQQSAQNQPEQADQQAGDSQQRNSDSQSAEPQTPDQQTADQQNSKGSEGREASETEQNNPNQNNSNQRAAELQNGESTDKQAEAEAAIATHENDELDPETQQQLEQLLRRVPDDPGGLLRNKLRYEARRRGPNENRKPPEEERW